MNKHVDDISFSALILGFSTAALQHLENAEAANLKQNLHLARQNIDIISLLSEKTNGNLEPDEASLIKEVLEDLKLKFIEASRS